MILGVNLLPFGAKLGGAGRYAKNIVRTLGTMDSDSRYVLFMNPLGRHHFPEESERFQHVICRVPGGAIPMRIAWEQAILPFQLRRVGIDALFTPSVAVPFLYRGTMFTTIHDIAYERVPGKYPPLRRAYIRRVTADAARRAHIIFTDTEFSKGEIVLELGVDPARIVVTSCGVDEVFLQPPAPDVVERVRRRYGLPDEFLLYVGALEPSKNIDALLVLGREARAALGRPVPLVVTGGLGWKTKESLEDLLRSMPEVDVRVLPYVDDAELAALYSRALVFVYLSPYEGFGLPVLEAMACGVPVLTSTAGAIVEVAGDGALCVDVSDANAVRRGLRTLLTDQKHRRMACERGKMTARRYTWNASATIIHERLKKELAAR